MIEQLYRVVVRLLPREVRQRFADEMIDTARAIDRDRSAPPWRRMRRTMGAIGDAVALPVSIRADLRRDARRQSFPITGRQRMDAFFGDIRFAVRGLRREPWFTTFCAVTLALGIGANAAIFGIADRLLLRGPDHVRDSNQVVRLYWTNQLAGRRPFTTAGFGYVSYDMLAHDSRTLSGVATYAINSTILGTGAEARPVNVGYATAGLFPLLGVNPEAGRFFTEREDAPGGAERVAVLSDGAGRAWFGGADAALGKTITLADAQYTVIGVAPHGFDGPQFSRVDVWVPGTLLASRVTAGWQTSWNAQWLSIVGRLKPGVTIAQAGEDATAIHRAHYNGGTDGDSAKATLSVASLRADDSGNDSADLRILQWLAGVSALVLLIACANIANLMIARGMRRGREVAIRSALGASRFRVVRLMLVEALLLATAGAALGTLVAYLLGGAARTLLFNSVDWTTSAVNLRVLVVSAIVAALTGLLIGIVPALRSTRANLSDALKTGVREGGGHRSRLRTGLTIAQASLSVLLLIGAGLFVRSLWKAYTLDLGFDADRVTSVEVSRQNLSRFPEGPQRDSERTRRAGFYADILGRVRAIPGVERASIATGMPFGNRFSVKVRVPGLDALPKLPGGGPGVSAVTADYFETMGTKIVRGRAFTMEDHAGTEPVAIVSQLMAETLWPGRDSIGECFYSGDKDPACARVVGIAANTYRSRLSEAPVMHYYIPAGQEVGFGGASLLVRTADGRPTEEVRHLLSTLDPTITYVTAATVRERIAPQMRPWRLGATVFAIAGLLALVVAGIGIYSVVSYLVADRRHEIGVRLALGARTADIVRLVLRGSVVMAAIGVVIGEAIALSLGGLAAPLLFSTSPRDPLVFAGVGGTLLIVAILATLGPAAKARRVSAVEALRTE